MNLIFTLPARLFEIHVSSFFLLYLGFAGALLPLSFPAKSP